MGKEGNGSLKMKEEVGMGLTRRRSVTEGQARRGNLAPEK